MQKHFSRIALRTSFFYWFLAALWILLSDKFLESLTNDQVIIDKIQLYKGWFFVTITAISLHITLRKQLSQLGNEIEERKRAELARDESQQKFQLLTESLPQLIWTCDSEGLADYFAPQWETYTGRPLAEQMGLGWFSQIYPDDREALKKYWQENVANGIPCEREFRIRRHDGIYRWFFTRAVPMRDETGKIYKWVGTNTDIQEQRELREELSLREEHLRLATEAAQLGTWERDLRSNSIFWSARMEQLMDFAPGTFPGTVEAFTQLIAPEDLARYNDARAVAQQNGGKYNIELRFNLPSGRSRYALVYGQTIFDSEGNPQRLVGVDLDITERKKIEAELHQSQSRLRLALAAGKMGMWTWDIQADMIVADATFSSLFGLPDENFKGTSQDFLTLVYEDDRNNIRVAIQTALTNRQSYDAEFRIALPNNKTRWIHSTGQGVYSQDNQLEAFIGVSYDVTARRETEEALRRERSQLKTVFESIQEGIVVTDKNGKFLLVNDAEVKINGFNSADEMLQNLTFFAEKYELFQLNGAPLSFDDWPIKRILRGEVLSQLELKVHRHDLGKEMYFSFSGSPIYDENGQLMFAIISNRDITAAKQAEATIKESEDRFRTLFNESATGNIILDARKRTIIDCNLTATNIFGYAKEELLGKNICELGAQLTNEEVNQLFLKTARGEFSQVETTIKTKAGELRNVIVVPKKIWINGKVFGYGSIIDITESKQAEFALKQERLRLEKIAAASPSALCTYRITPNGEPQFVYISNAIRDIYGLTPEQLQKDATNIFQLFNPEDTPRVKASVQHSAQHLTLFHEAWRINHPQKGERWIESNSMPVRDADGGTTWHGILSDVTDKKRSEVTLLENEARLQLLSDLSRNFVEAGPDFNSVLDQVVRSVTSTIDDYCSICLFTEDSKSLKTAAKFHPDADLQAIINQVIPDELYQLTNSPIDKLILEKKEAVLIPEVDNEQFATCAHPRYFELLKRVKFRSFILAPMRIEGKITGMIAVGRTKNEKGLLNKKDLHFIQEVADRAALVLRTAQLYNQLQSELSKRRAVELSLLKERERFEATAAIAPGGLYSFRQNADGVFSFPYASANLTNLLSLELEKLGDDISPFFAQIHPDDLSPFEAIVAESARSLTPCLKTWRVITADNEIKWISANSIPLKEPDGSIIWHGVMLDVTNQKKQEQALAEREKLLRAINNATPNIIALWDVARGKIDYVNEAVQSILGYSVAETMEKDFLAMRELYHPDNQLETKEFLARFQRLEDGTLDSHEYRILHKNGEWRTLLARDSVFARDKDGRVAKILGVAEDITIRKQQEEKLIQSHEQLRELTQKLQTVREEERRYLARELHDEIGQLMTGLKYLLEIIGLATETLQLKPVAEAQELANSVLLKVRQLSLDLRPGMLDDLGLIPALLWHCNRFRTQTNINVQITHTGIEGKRFGMETETAAYRIIQEALTNIARHAHCKEAAVHIWIDNQILKIQIQDYGQGFDALAIASSAESSGLVGMRERATILGGTFVIESEPNCGTTIFATIPLR